MGHGPKKDCDGVRELLSPFLEGDLGTAEHRAVEKHLETCEECAADLALLRQALRDLREIPELPAPAAILAGVREGIRPRKERWAPGRFFAGWSRAGFPIGAAATILVAFGIFLLAERFPDIGKAPAPVTESAPREEPVPGDRGSTLDNLRRNGIDDREDRNEETDLAEIPEAEKTAPKPSAAAGISGQSTPLPPTWAASGDRDGATSFGKRASPSTIRPAGRKEAVETLKAQREAPPSPPPPAAAPMVPAGELRDSVASQPSPSPADGKDDQLLETGGIVLRGADLDLPEEVPPPTAAPVEKKVWTPLPPPPAPVMKMKRRTPEEPAAPPEPSLQPAPAAEPASKMMRKRPEKGVMAEPSVGDEEDLGYYRKSLPPHTGRKMEQSASPDSRLGFAQSPEQEFGEGKAAGGAGQTEILTIVSFTEDEVRQVRESIAKNGGTLLEMENLDAMASQQVALPYQVQIPDYDNISRGWQVRALVPAAQVEELVASLRDLPRLQLLERVQVPDAGTPVPGVRNVQINLIRQSGPAPAMQ